MSTGGYSPGQTKWMCPKSKYTNLGNTKFEVQNQNTKQSFDLGDDCYNGLVSEIEKCKWGGELSYAGRRSR
jgi:hypothetical protein